MTCSRIASGITALAAVVLLASACTSTPGDGPLGNGGTSGGICLAVRPGEVMSWGLTYLANSGNSDAVIENVSLVDPRNLSLAASYVVPITGNMEYGAWPGYPPPARAQRGVEWSRHTAAVGARIPPLAGQFHSDLVTVLQPTARVAKATAIDVIYREGGTQYQMQTRYRLVLLTGMGACPADWVKKYPA